MATRANFNREQRQADAKTRQTAYKTLTVAQKLAKLDSGGFTATKQRAKLAAIQEVSNESQSKEATPGRSGAEVREAGGRGPGPSGNKSGARKNANRTSASSLRDRTSG